MKERGGKMLSEYPEVGRALTRNLCWRFDAVIKGKIRSEYPEVGRLFAAYLCWRFDAVIIGAEHIPTSGGLLLLGNHQEVFDGPLVLYGARPRKVRLVVKNDGENHLALSLLRQLTGALTINRNTGDLEAVKMVENILERGDTACMLPEGHRSGQTGKVIGFHPGVAVIARHVPSAKIVPFGITSAGHLTVGKVVKNLDRGIHRRNKPTIKFGRPFQLPPAHLSKREQRDVDVTFIRRQVLNLLPPELEGEDILYVVGQQSTRG